MEIENTGKITIPQNKTTYVYSKFLNLVMALPSRDFLYPFFRGLYAVI
jgi:hypothetical protein